MEQQIIEYYTPWIGYFYDTISSLCYCFIFTGRPFTFCDSLVPRVFTSLGLLVWSYLMDEILLNN